MVCDSCCKYSICCHLLKNGGIIDLDAVPDGNVPPCVSESTTSADDANAQAIVHSLFDFQQQQGLADEEVSRLLPLAFERKPVIMNCFKFCQHDKQQLLQGLRAMAKL